VIQELAPPGERLSAFEQVELVRKRVEEITLCFVSGIIDVKGGINVCPGFMITHVKFY
jgi:hypothetical protein